jgi:protein involved in polysaccharide export with SLBB domain
VMPGRKEIPADRPIDIMDAIALGSGFSPRADKNKIILRRKGQVTNYSKKDLDKLYEQGQRVMIEPDDTLEVRESIL